MGVGASRARDLPDEHTEDFVPAGSWASSPARRRIMRSIHSRDTAPELVLRRRLHARGLRYRVHWPLPFDRRRRMDIAFTRARVAVFVDGCFWHGCPLHYRSPSVNTEYWSTKIAGNVRRDLDTTERLLAAGWLVLRFWAHEDPDSAVKAVEDALASRPGRRGNSGRLQRLQILSSTSGETPPH